MRDFHAGYVQIISIAEAIGLSSHLRPDSPQVYFFSEKAWVSTLSHFHKYDRIYGITTVIYY
jgi:hypothetical protein